MIFVTVGAQMPFDRLIRTVDDWAARRGRTDVFAQIGATHWHPQHIEWAQFIAPNQFQRRVAEADVVVAHAGIGSILVASEQNKTILVMPRSGELKETRNDHQFATAKRFGQAGYVVVAWNEAELTQMLDRLDEIACTARPSLTAAASLLDATRRFIGGETVAACLETRSQTKNLLRAPSVGRSIET